jgi:predicted phage tail protein
MSVPTGFDLRFALGSLFVVLGALLVLASFTGGADANARSLGVDVNLFWGALMIVFGGVCLMLARRDTRRRS